MDFTTCAALVSAAVGILTCFVFFLVRYLKKEGNTILIVGLSDSGKTTIFTQLTRKFVDYNYIPETFSSMQENEVLLNVKGKIRKIVDYPGNDRLRRKLIQKYLKTSTILKVVFVVDAVTFSKLARDVAELLYDVLLENGKPIPILVACHKQDFSLAKTNKVIENALEKEMGLINKSRSAALKESDGSETRRSTLTDTGIDFKWTDLKDQSIQFLLTSSRSEDYGIEPIISFIEN